MQRIRGLLTFLSLLIVAGLAIALAAPQAKAAEVTLRMKGGGFSVSGELVSFDNFKYVIVSKAFGRMGLDAQRFDCIGNACPPPNRTVQGSVTPTALTPPAIPSVIRISGSNALGGELMPTLIREYAAKLGIRVTSAVGADRHEVGYKLTDKKGRSLGAIKLARKGSSSAFSGLLAGHTDIGMTSRRIRQKEISELSAAGLPKMQEPGNEHVIALDGLMVLVAPENPAVSISTTNIAKIFSGQITDWSEIGLPPGRIKAYMAAKDSGTRDLFESLVLEPEGLKLSPQVTTILSHDERSDAVARDPLAITVAGLGSQRNAKALNVETSCGLITRPSRFTVKTEEYPLARRLYLYTSGLPKNQIARGLLQFALSSAAQPVIASAQFVDQSAEILAFRDQGGRIAHALNAPQEDFDMNMMRRLIKQLSSSKRMSLTFRFRSGGSALDTRSQQDVRELQRLMLSSEQKGKSVLLLGFADSAGSFVNNLSLSLRRAQQVKRALLSGAGAKIPPESVTEAGYSELAPVACNTTERGRTLNRRVEVWIRN